MNKSLFAIAFLLGACAISWMAASFAGQNNSALAITLVIGAAYLIGIAELLGFRSATQSLDEALSKLKGQSTPELEPWCATLHPTLRSPVLLRVRGNNTALPAPIFTPYLVGLLVMLGLLGTFIGMVDTLQGAVGALQGSTELEAIRNGLAAPIQGLGVAFGTSVAGISASAMLGLNSTLSRRERLLAIRELDAEAIRAFQKYSLSHNQNEAFIALQNQAEALPAVADRLQDLAQQLERMSDHIGEKLIASQQELHSSISDSAEKLHQSIANKQEELHQSISNKQEALHRSIADSQETMQQSLASTVSSEQESLHSSITTAYSDLAGAVEKSLRDSIEKSTRAVNQGIEPLVSETLNLISQGTAQAHQDYAATASEQLASMRGSMTESVESISKQLASADEARQQSWLSEVETLHSTSSAQLKETVRLFAEELKQLGDSQVEALNSSTEKFDSLSSDLSVQWKAAAEGAVNLQEKLGSSTSDNIERDTSLLEERAAVLQQLDELASSLQTNTANQGAAIEQLIASSGEMLQQASREVSETVSGEASRLDEASGNLANGAAEMNSLGESFNAAVQLFSQSNKELQEKLGQVEESLVNVSSRSDAQMGYYVAQAREIIDQSLLSQQELIEQFRAQDTADDTPAAQAS